MPLNNYQGVIQTAATSCGAFALGAAIAEFHPAGLINALDVNNLGNGYTVFTPAPFSQSLYEFTGNLFINGQQATYRYQVPPQQMSSPSGMVMCALGRGIAAHRIAVRYTVAGNAMFGAIQVTNNGAAANLLLTETNLITQVNVNVQGPALYAPPAANQVHLLVVDNGMHWIVITQNQVYDSASGFVGAYQYNANPTTITYQHNGIVTQCDFSGIWIAFA